MKDKRAFSPVDSGGAVESVMGRRRLDGVCYACGPDCDGHAALKPAPVITSMGHSPMNYSSMIHSSEANAESNALLDGGKSNRRRNSADSVAPATRSMPGSSHSTVNGPV